MREIPSFISRLSKHGHSAKSITLSKPEMINVAVKCEEQRINLENKHKPAHILQLSFDEAIMRTVLNEKMKDGHRFAY